MLADSGHDVTIHEDSSVNSPPGLEGDHNQASNVEAGEGMGL